MRRAAGRRVHPHRGEATELPTRLRVPVIPFGAVKSPTAATLWGSLPRAPDVASCHWTDARRAPDVSWALGWSRGQAGTQPDLTACYRRTAVVVRMGRGPASSGFLTHGRDQRRIGSSETVLGMIAPPSSGVTSFRATNPLRSDDTEALSRIGWAHRVAHTAESDHARNCLDGCRRTINYR